MNLTKSKFKCIDETYIPYNGIRNHMNLKKNSYLPGFWKQNYIIMLFGDFIYQYGYISTINKASSLIIVGKTVRV